MLFGYVCMVVVGRTFARSNVFAQANMFGVGETCRNRPKFTVKLSLRRRTLVLSEVLSRSSKKGLPKREHRGTWGTSL